MDQITPYQQWLEDITAKLKPNRKTVAQLEQYLINQYGAQPIILSKERLRFIEQEIILRHYSEAKNHKIPMDIAAYTFPLQAENATLGTFTLVLERITEEIYQFDFAVAKGQNTSPTAINPIMKDILLYQGLSQEDIDKRTHRFLHYISTLCYYNDNTSDYIA
ncbi:MAG: hypothetical protein HFI72_03000 [Peptococcaceae bacterium]|jgi:hypothetical protein|nr:hypothetical protein [Peptococcaceae bacterium]